MRVLRPCRSALLLVLSLGLLAADCEGPGPGSQGGQRSFHVDLGDLGPEQGQRSQRIYDKVWYGGPSVKAVVMERPIALQAEVYDADGGTFGAAEVAVFLLSEENRSELGGVVDSLGGFSARVPSGSYDVLIAPAHLLEDEPARFVKELVVDDLTPAQSWSVEPNETLRGRVKFLNDEPVVGAVVGVFRDERPQHSLGVTAITADDEEGSFELDLPAGTYTLVVSTPADGSVPIPPVRWDRVQVPQPAGTYLEIRYPVLSSARVRIELKDITEGTLQGRVRVDGWIADPRRPGHDFTGGRFRAEFETDADGSYELDLPVGSYTATGFPRLAEEAQIQSVGSTQFEVPELADELDVALTLPSSGIARIVVREPASGDPLSGAPVGGATINLQMRSPPRFAYSFIAAPDGAIAALLPPDLYDVEVIPATELVEEIQTKRWARIHGALDLSSGFAVLDMNTEPSDFMGWVVIDEDSQALPGVRVMAIDRESGLPWDETVTDEQGAFRLMLPEQR